MKNLKSLTAAFALLVTTAFAARAQSQNDTTNQNTQDSQTEQQTSYPAMPSSSNTPYDRHYGGPQNYDQGNVVSDRAILEVARSNRMEKYPCVGLGFTSGFASNGEHVGIEFRLNRKYRPDIIQVFNLSNPHEAARFLEERDLAKRNENDFRYNNRDCNIPYYPDRFSDFNLDPLYNRHGMPGPNDPNPNNYFYTPGPFNRK